MPSKRLIYALLVSSIFVLSCASKPENQIVGKWFNIESNSSQKKLEFFKDGTLIVNEEVTFKYHIIDKERMEWNLGNIGDSGEIKLIVKYKVSENELKLINPEELRRLSPNSTGESSFRRVK